MKKKICMLLAGTMLAGSLGTTGFAQEETTTTPICKEWIAGGMTESVEDMAHLCDSIFGNIHKRLMQKG